MVLLLPCGVNFLCLEAHRLGAFEHCQLTILSALILASCSLFKSLSRLAVLIKCF